MSLTKQGVRNLDPPKQKNERKRDWKDACFHEWKHDPDCPCTFVDTSGHCYQICRKCGARRE